MHYSRSIVYCGLKRAVVLDRVPLTDDSNAWRCALVASCFWKREGLRFRPKRTTVKGYRKGWRARFAWQLHLCIPRCSTSEDGFAAFTASLIQNDKTSELFLIIIIATLGVCVCQNNCFICVVPWLVSVTLKCHWTESGVIALVLLRTPRALHV